MTRVQRLIEEGVLRAGVPLGSLTTYKVGGPARYFARVDDLAQLERVIESGLTRDYPLLVLGRGSNLVVSSSGFPGLVIFLGEGFSFIRIEGQMVTAGAAVPLPRLARSTVEAGLSGLEFFVGIPGSVGGAVRQNAGCFGSETSDRLIEAALIDLTTAVTRRSSPDDLELSYRHSNLTESDLVLEAVFSLQPGDPEKGLREIRRITRWRRDHQPGGTLNAGSVFKNPPDASAGELIDELGLKGLRVGDVSVSDKHANFFVAGADATPEDIVALIDLVKDRVLESTGTNLETEIQLVGFES